uniref:TonB family protein n=1 Tax=candidate division WOR-3 bacterium TaxID=2052148 RepID=A0A7V3RG30_UNCW3
MKKLWIILVLIGLTVYCAKKEEPLKGEKGGRLVIGTTDLPGILSPLQPSVLGSNDILDLLFMRLHRIDPKTGKMKPELASSWEFSEDLTSVTYYLRKDIKWWDGEPVTAEDVLYTYEKMQDPKTNYPFVASLKFIKKVELINKYTIKFTFTRVYANLLTDSDIMPVPKHIYEKFGSEFGKTKIVGNGPYKVKEWIPGSALVLSANDEYYRGRPPLDEIIIKYYANSDQMIADFEQGNLDIVLNITPAEAKRLSINQNINIASKPGNSYIYIGWNLDNEFLKDKEIRKALTMAINRTQILNDVFLGMGRISLGPLPHSSWAFNEEVTPIEFNLAKAKDILSKKGFEDRNRNKIIDKNGKDFVLTIITNVENPDRVQTLNYIANYLSQLGIKVNSQTMDVNSFITALINRKYDGFIMGWSVSDKIDPTLYWHSDPNRGKFNFIGYKNSAIDSLIDLGTVMLNRRKAKEIWGEFQKRVYEDQPYTFLVVPNEISANYKRVKGTEEGITLASAYTYWIPETERRVTIAAKTTPVPQTPTPAPTTPTPPSTTTPVTPVTPTTPTTPPTSKKEETPKPSPAISPEKLLEAAAASKETTSVASAPPTPPPVAPAKPSVITRPEPIKKVFPKYPESARALGVSGRVLVRVIVGTDGKVKTATIYSSFGNPACEEAALAAAKQWEFKPATKDGEPFEQAITIPFDFKP